MSIIVKRVPAGMAQGSARARTVSDAPAAKTRSKRLRTRPDAIVANGGSRRIPRRARRVATSPSRPLADEDATLLQRAGMRGIRLQLDYWKVEARLQNERIGHAVVMLVCAASATRAGTLRRCAEAALRVGIR
ncbi:hypothetical protein [Burkholderia sp. Bp9142]|uniref:hypothetical protein n=1 Tax=Burkholderia sp. Bp9142 TaxID=2184573 RepID=UPI0021AB3AB5|nr:hypothetical protein [Burkholderia sp. Bp9142]